MTPIMQYLALLSLAPSVSAIIAHLALLASVITTPYTPITSHHHVAVQGVTFQTVAALVNATPKRKRSNKRSVLTPSGSSTISSTSPDRASKVAVNMTPSPVLPTTLSQAAHPSPPSSFSDTQAPEPTHRIPSTSPTPTTTTSPTSMSQAPPDQTFSAFSGDSSSNAPSNLNNAQSGQGISYETGLGACSITNINDLLSDAYPYRPGFLVLCILYTG